jgi:hypothetical protein
MSEESHGSGNVVAGVIAALVICALIIWLFATLAEESLGSVTLLTLPMTLFGVWAVVYFSRASSE